MKIVEDFNAFTQGGNLKKKIATLLFNPCFHSVVLYRSSAFVFKCRLHFLAKIIWYINRVVFAVDIDYRADLAGGLVLIHGIGTVIGKDVISKGKLTIYQGVTIGGSGKKNIVDGVERYQPLIENGVIIYANAMVLGGIHISKNTIIKAGERITKNY